MDKSKLAAFILAGLSTALLTDRALSHFRDRKDKVIKGDNPLWDKAWNSWERISYNTTWAGNSNVKGTEWDNLWLDRSLKPGKCVSCAGPNGTRALIVVTHMYGSVAISNREGELFVHGDPRLYALKHDEVKIFSTPLSPSWIGSILDPESEIYGISTNEGWSKIVEFSQQLDTLTKDKVAMESRFQVLADELAQKQKRIIDLNVAINLQKLGGRNPDSFLNACNSTATFQGHSLEIPATNTDGAIIAFNEITFTEIEEIEVDADDADGIYDKEASS